MGDEMAQHMEGSVRRVSSSRRQSQTEKLHTDARMLLKSLVCLTILFVHLQPIAAGPTIVDTDISVATTFRRDDSPYIIANTNGITVQASGSLTIEPGVTVH